LIILASLRSASEPLPKTPPGSENPAGGGVGSSSPGKLWLTTPATANDHRTTAAIIILTRRISALGQSLTIRKT
jgi:hypothetical protein